jgi:hypothetical protein
MSQKSKTERISGGSRLLLGVFWGSLAFAFLLAIFWMLAQDFQISLQKSPVSGWSSNLIITSPDRENCNLSLLFIKGSRGPGALEGSSGLSFLGVGITSASSKRLAASSVCIYVSYWLPIALFLFIAFYCWKRLQGKNLLEFLSSRRRPTEITARCGKCGYDLRGGGTDKCPECGTMIPKPE